MLLKFFDENRDVKRVVDIGTGCGGLTLFFGANMLQRDGKVLSFDIDVLQSTQAQRDFEKLNIRLEERDVFEEESVAMVRKFIEGEQALIFCDNGNKGREFPLYARTLKRGDFIMAHDWGVEISAGNLDGFIHTNLELYKQDEFDKEETYILSMRRI
jgi:predicted O-methyltransferase YrrM